MNFRDLLKKIKGLHIKYNSGMARVEEVYWNRDTALILVDAGTSYTAHNEYRGISLTFISDGTDRICVDIAELEIFN